MHPAFMSDTYLLKRQVLALTGKFRLYDPAGQVVLFSEQAMFKLRENIHVYADESKSQELLTIQARQIIDFSAAYDVIDSQYQQTIGTLRRRGWRSMARDEWDVLDSSEQVVGKLQEDDVAKAMLRRFILGGLLPQNFDLLVAGGRAVDLRQHFNPFRYELEIDFNQPAAGQIDHRLGIAAAILIATVERRQREY
jgi:uncharacterized protein YxjI